ncbi:MAG: dipeptide ABC transporter ATP-binding protein [Cellvibrionaceae bacterium]|nr:dipeptide ABC transporter ATP-binding protein [Cellvibrionaceae bacterium]
MSVSTTANSANLLELKHLSLGFTQNNHVETVVVDSSFALARGETLALVGESGSGKSLSALAIMRLLPQPAGRILQGAIHFAGEDLLQLSQAQMRAVRGKRIGMIFQEPMTALNPVHRIGAQLTEVLMLHRPDLDASDYPSHCITLLEQVGIDAAEARLKHYPHQLSGGMRQRVMIAMAIAGEPELLIADEPTTALDVTTQLAIMQLLQALQARMGMAMLLISHNLPLVKHYADKIVVMHRGRVVESATTDALFSKPQAPYTQRLLAARCAGKAVDLGAATQCARPLLAVDKLQVNVPLSKGFWGNVTQWQQAVKQVSFEVQSGQTLGIVGESGSGKTSLALALLQLIPSEGCVRLNGVSLQDKRGRALRALRKHLQIVLQDPFGSLSPRMTIAQIIAEGLSIHTRLSAAQKQVRVLRVLDAVGLADDCLGRYPHEFSGGQRQRIAIARALVVEPQLIILDEPTSALDRSVQGQIIDLLKTLQQQMGISYIFISHDLEVIQAISHQLAVMRAGALVEYGPTHSLLSAPAQDYTRRLIQAAFY